ncbi:hypothetical protein GCWU000324_03036 [Kingella oralis ATCC 51147]|uniref:Uncharacterized protein n=1 Tax=Kingella oralis ATCC 51147 TaxID=629741 RepID=C4GMV0_9NEIS|nr:hypothetical protein GCWU000324_03036 [Kingella oralis ATCC 51147]
MQDKSKINPFGNPLPQEWVFLFLTILRSLKTGFPRFRLPFVNPLSTNVKAFSGCLIIPR